MVAGNVMGKHELGMLWRRTFLVMKWLWNGQRWNYGERVAVFFVWTALESFLELWPGQRPFRRLHFSTAIVVQQRFECTSPSLHLLGTARLELNMIKPKSLCMGWLWCWPVWRPDLQLLACHLQIRKLGGRRQKLCTRIYWRLLLLVMKQVSRNLCALLDYWAAGTLLITSGRNVLKVR